MDRLKELFRKTVTSYKFLTKNNLLELNLSSFCPVAQVVAPKSALSRWGKIPVGY